MSRNARRRDHWHLAPAESGIDKTAKKTLDGEWVSAYKIARFGKGNLWQRKHNQ
jgi:hypothetical protein